MTAYPDWLRDRIESLAIPVDRDQYLRAGRQLLAKHRLGRTKHEFSCPLPRPAIILSVYSSSIDVSGRTGRGRGVGNICRRRLSP
jgi:hypothetical protein